MSDEFESCTNCIHSGDSEPLCILRLCKHAIAEMKECYEPTQTNTFNTLDALDCVSRQAAIDALAEYIHNVDKVYSTGKLTADDCKDAVKSVLDELPSFSCDHEKDHIAEVSKKDCISRQDAIDEIGRFIGYIDEDMIERIRIGLKRLPSAQPEQRWIPCSERLPAYGEDVLISIGGYCNVGHIVSVNEEEQYNWYFSGWYHLPNDVDAWMPLPEPHKEGEG